MGDHTLASNLYLYISCHLFYGVLGFVWCPFGFRLEFKFLFF
jgi:hypothetical protein